jgi:signal transduction histidine kinase/DNA-binding response OmpR family regulator
MLFRKIEAYIANHLQSGSDKILVVDGARQIGKSYIIREVGKRLFPNYIEVNMETDKVGDRIFAEAKTVDDFYLALSSIAGDKMQQKENTLVFLDEIQAYDHLITLLKFLREDNKFTYIASGSLLGVTLKTTSSIPLGSIEIKHMYPLDFEEFLIANGVGKLVLETVQKNYAQRKAMPEPIHAKLMDLFRKYLLVGGLPDAVNEFLATKNITKVRKIQEDIHHLYGVDASRYEDSHGRLKILRIYEMVPSNLENKKKRVVAKDIENKVGKRMTDYTEEFDYLISSGITLEVKAISKPSFPLIENSGKNLLKLYMNDIGLLTNIFFGTNIKAVMEDIPSVNLGSVYETVVAQSIILITLYIFIRSYQHNQKRKEEARRKEIEQQMRERMNKEKMEFFSGITHELRTPMFLITAPLEELLSSDQQPVPVPRSYLTRMYRNAIRLNKLVNRILDIRKNDGGMDTSVVSRVELIEHCRRLAVDYQALCLQKNIHFRIIAPAKAIRITVDLEKLELVISNLITNAYKYTPQGGKVILKIIDHGENVEIQVIDNGIGISEKDQKRIFSTFFRAENSGMASGNGMGLAFVRRLAELMNGSISVKSKIGKGSTFSFTFPCHYTNESVTPSTTPLQVTEEDNNLELAENQASLPVIQSPLATQKILIIDDEEETREILQRYLHSEFIVLTAADGEEGLKVANDEYPDLIICDMMMPNLNGLHFLNYIKEDKKTAHIPVIMFTAKALDDDELAAFKYGADAYITKPVSLHYLRTRINSLLHKPLQLVNTVSGEAPKPEYSPEEKQFIQKCREVIDNNLNETEFNLSFMANALGTSTSTLYKKIKKITGRSAIEFINDYRIFKAIEMFRKGETNVTKVAQATGYRDIRTFRAAFKLRTNMSPTDYIKKI